MITQPTLFVDKNRVQQNLQRMIAKSQRHQLRLRPHMKTHQSRIIGNWIKEAGIEQITVSSVTMAQYFASQFQDITIAFPVNIHEIEQIKTLQNQTQLGITVESAEITKHVDKQINKPIDVWVKIDSGYHRTGIPYNSYNLLDAQMEALQNAHKLRFKGFLTHAGHTYQAVSPNEIRGIFKLSNQAMRAVQERYAAIFPDAQVSVGDTPSCSLAADFSGIDEIRPGNFFFYDAMQQKLGSCNWQDVAVCMACPVVAVHPERKALVIYGGGVHFSKEFIEIDGRRIYGYATKITPQGWDNPDEQIILSSLSQEHGTITYPTSTPPFQAGDFVGIIPIHSCMTANLMQGYQLTTGEHIDHLTGYRKNH